MKKKLKVGLIIGASVAVVAGVTSAIIFNPTNMAGTMSNPDKTITYNVHASSKELNLSYDTTFDFRFNDFFEDVTQYNGRIAKFCFLEALDVHNNALVKKSDSTVEDQTKNIQFLESLGFDSIEEMDIFNSYDTNKNDTTRGVFGYAKNFVGTNKLVVVSLQGTMKSSEWASNFDVGNSTDEYSTLTGADVTPWLNKDNHKGYDVTSYRVIEKLTDYIQNTVLKNTNNLDNLSVIFTGYSRGAALANVCAQQLIDSSISGTYKSIADEKGCAIKVGAYTYGTPTTTTSSAYNDAKYASIFNHVSNEDLMTHLVPESMGFKRYGVDVSLTMFGKQDLLNRYKTLIGKEYVVLDFTADVVDALSTIIPTRENLYVVDMSEEGTVYDQFYTQNATEAENKRAQLIATLQSANVYQYCVVSDVKDITISGYTCKGVTLNYSTGLLLGVLPTIVEILNSGANVLTLASYYTLIDCEKYETLVSTVIGGLFQTGAFDSVAQYHMPPAYMITLEAYIASL